MLPENYKIICVVRLVVHNKWNDQPSSKNVGVAIKNNANPTPLLNKTL